MKALPIQFDESIPAWEKAIDAFLAEKACRSGSIDIPFDVAISPDQVQRARNPLNIMAVLDAETAYVIGQPRRPSSPLQI